MTGEHPVDRIFAQVRERAIYWYDRFSVGYDLDRAEKTILLAKRCLPLLIANLAYLASVKKP